MWQLNVRIEHSGAAPDGVMKRDVNRAMKTAFDQTGHWFLKNKIPIRFTQRGFYLLQYSKRSPKYERSKITKFGHRDPLVYTGITRDNTLSGSRVKATGQGNDARARIILNARGLNRRPKNSKINKADEVRRVAPAEGREAAAQFDRFMKVQISKLAADAAIRKISIRAFI